MYLEVSRTFGANYLVYFPSFAIENCFKHFRKILGIQSTSGKSWEISRLPENPGNSGDFPYTFVFDVVAHSGRPVGRRGVFYITVYICMFRPGNYPLLLKSVEYV